MLVRLGAFAGALALLFAAAAVAGSEIGPDVEEGSTEMNMDGHNPQGASEVAEAVPPGLAVAEDGLRLVPAQSQLERGAGQTVRFRIVDSSGATVRDFEVEHERRMHLILVRRDLQEFQHLHPTQLEDGSWEAEANLPRAGAYRAFADFATAETSVTLGADLFVAGEFDAEPLPPPKARASAGDGYEVALDAPVANTAEFTVFRNGEKVKSVEPYLGADGHLVALREGDLAFLHTHPEGPSGGPISFAVEYPSVGRYRLFLQFRHRGEVRTAVFTQEVSDERH